MHCVSCGSALPNEASFCPSCGHRVEHRHDERRVVTVVFADIVGFTALSESTDPEQVKNLVDAVFARVATDVTEFGGRVDKVLGDGLLAIFGAPVAHEDDAERAVRASLAILGTVESFNAEFATELQVRIGVNTGEVLVGEIRAAGDYTAMGDVVNIASRLSDVALPGQVMVGSETHETTSGAIEYEAGNELNLSGRAEPVAVWVAKVAVGLPGQRHTARTKLVGRDIEFSIAQQSVDSAFRLRRSLLMLVMGEAGVGKSRLALEVAAYASNSGAAVLTGRCVPYGEANAWFPIAEAVKAALDLKGIDQAHPEVQLADAVAGTVASPEEQNRLVNGLLYLFDFSSPLDAIEPKHAQDEAARSARLVFEAIAQTRPVFLRLVDLHWADSLVLSLVNDLVQRLVHQPFVVMATSRFSLTENWSPQTGRHNNLTLTLDPLESGAALQLAESLLPQATPEMRADLVARSGGNPFFLEELASLVESGGMVDGDELPATIRGLVAARLDRLGPAEAAVIEDAAVLGRRGLVMALQKMADARGVTEAINTLVVSLVSSDILELGDESQWWEFHSDLVREVAYNRLTKSDRALRHFGVADYIEATFGSSVAPTTVAHHYLRAAELTNEMARVDGVPDDINQRALLWVNRAADASVATERWDTAVALYGQALGLLGSDDSADVDLRIQALLGRVEAHTGARDIDKAVADLDVVEVLTFGHPLFAPAVALRRGEIEQRRANLELALKFYDEALDGFRAQNDLAGVAEVQRTSGMAFLMSGASEQAEASMKDALAASLELGDRRNEAWARQNLAWLGFVQGRTAKANERIEKSLELFRSLGDEIGVSWSNGLLAFVRMHQGRFEESSALAEVTLADAAARNDAWAEGMMHVLLASVNLWGGRTAQAVESAETAVGLFRSINDAFGLVQSGSILGRSLIRLGRVDEGFRVIRDAIGVLPESNDGIGQLAKTTLSTGNVTVGRPAPALEQLGNIVTADIDPSLVGQSERVVAYGLALLQEGRLDEARSTLEFGSSSKSDLGSNPSAIAALSYCIAAEGDLAKAGELVARVHASGRATYVDKLRVQISLGLASAVAGDSHGAAEGFADAKALLSTTGDRLGYALTTLAHALSSKHLGLVNADILRLETEERLAELGIEANGWRQAFNTILGNSPSVSALAD